MARIGEDMCSFLCNKEIEIKVKKIMNYCIKISGERLPGKETEIDIIHAGTDLLINLLQNLNDLANWSRHA